MRIAIPFFMTREDVLESGARLVILFWGTYHKHGFGLNLNLKPIIK